MLNVRSLKVLVASLALGASALVPALAQGTTTLRNPLIPGAQSTGPGIAAADGQPEIPGDGPTPTPEIQGMTGDPTLEPWVTAVPANNINLGNTGVNLPVTPQVESPPGVLGPALTGLVPPPPSTPGADPGMLQVPPASTNTFNAAEQVNVDQGGGLPGTGGANGSIPNIRRRAQTTVQLERRGRNVALGEGSGAKGGIQDNIVRFGKDAGLGIVFGVPNGDQCLIAGGGHHGRRNSAIDLGGGQRIKVGGVKLSTGSSIQDFGLSDTRGNAIAALNAQQSTEFGQGTSRTGKYFANTTNFGGPYTRFSPANVNRQKKGQLLPPKAIETDH